MEHPGTSNNHDNYEKKCVKLNFGLAHATIWSAQIGQVKFCFFSRAEQLCLEMNAYERTFHHGKSIEKYMYKYSEWRRECFNRVLPRKFQSDRIKVQSKRCYSFKRMEDLLKRQKTLSLHADARGQPKRLAEPELDLVQLLIKCRPSRTMGVFCGQNFEREYIDVLLNKLLLGPV